MGIRLGGLGDHRELSELPQWGSVGAPAASDSYIYTDKI